MPQTTEQKISLQEFGHRVKAKYPQYSSLSDIEVGNRVLAKYPQYRDRVEEPEGFLASFSKGMFGKEGLKGLRESGKAIVRSVGALGDPFGLAFRPKQQEIAAAPVKGVAALGKSLISDVPRGLAGNEEAAGRAIQGPGALVGAPAFQKGIKQTEEGNAAGALGSFSAGLMTAVLMLAPELAGAKGEKIVPESLRDAAKGEAVLPSGQTMPVTRAMLKGGHLERVAAHTVGGGGAILDVYADAQEAAQRNIAELAKSSVGEQGARVAESALPKGMPEQVELYGKALRDFSSKQYYQPVIKAMASPAAAQPVVENVAKVALRELESQEIKGLLTRNQEFAPAIRESLQKMAEAGGIGPEGRKFMGAQVFDPRTGQYTRGTPTFEPAISAGAESSFDAMRGAQSNLRAVLRSGRLERGDRRIVHLLLDQIDGAVTDALESTGGKKLAEDYRTAARLYNQGSALEEFASEIRKIVSGRGETAVKGAKPVPVHLEAKKLQAILEDMAYESPALPGRVQGKSRLRQAFPNPAHEESLKEIADLLARPDGDKLVSSMFGDLSEIRHAGSGVMALAGAGAGAVFGHSVVSAAVGAAALPVGAAIFARAIYTPQGARLVLRFLQAAPSSAQRANLGLKILQQQGATQ